MQKFVKGPLLHTTMTQQSSTSFKVREVTWVDGQQCCPLSDTWLHIVEIVPDSYGFHEGEDIEQTQKMKAPGDATTFQVGDDDLALHFRGSQSPWDGSRVEGTSHFWIIDPTVDVDRLCEGYT